MVCHAFAGDLCEYGCSLVSLYLGPRHRKLRLHYSEGAHGARAFHFGVARIPFRLLLQQFLRSTMAKAKAKVNIINYNTAIITSEKGIVLLLFIILKSRRR